MVEDPAKVDPEEMEVVEDPVQVDPEVLVDQAE